MEQSVGSRRPAAGTRSATIHELVANHARERPNQLAVACGNRRVSFGDLDQRANRLAHHLLGGGVGVEHVVGVLLPRSVDGIVAMLAVLRAGAAYLPLDPTYPPARLGLMVRDADPTVVVSDWPTAGALGETQVRRLALLDVEGPLIEDRPSTSPDVHVDPNNLAYLMYTSGSTGVPKAVAVTQGNVVNLVQGQHYVRFGSDRSFLAVASPAFDAATFEVWGALCNGAAVVIVPDRVPSAEAIRAAVAAHGPGVAVLTTTFFNVLADTEPTALTGLHEVVVGGEAMSAAHARRVHSALPGLELVNGYGPTECTTFATCHRLTDADTGSSVPIGVPLEGVEVRVLDEELRPVPDGEVGELCIGGRGVVRGYHRRPDVTAERFVPDPVPTVPGARLYRSGDLARRRPNGVIEYVGRADEQLKVRGHRIEPAEVEATLLSHPDIAHAVVIADPLSKGGAKRLVAYVVGHTHDPPASDVRAHVRDRLPEHMVPHAFVALPRLPLTANGKLDRNALPLPPSPESRPASRTSIRDPVADVLRAIWSELLGIEEVGDDIDFFAMGGDSLISVRTAALAAARGLIVPPGAVYAAPTLRALSEVVQASSFEGVATAGSPPAPLSLVAAEVRERLPAGVADAYPMTALQTGMLFHSTFADGTGIYHSVVRHRFDGPWRRGCFEDAVHAVVTRHAVLRTTFEMHRYCEPTQMVHRAARPAVTVATPGRLLRRRRHTMIEYASTAFDWATRPPLRVHAEIFGPRHFEVVLAFHHALLDGWSVTLLFAELAEEYRALLHGRRPSTARPATTFARYVELEREATNSSEAATFWAARTSGAPCTRVTRGTHTVELRYVASQSAVVEAAVVARVGEQARRLHVPAKSVFLAAHAATVAAALDAEDVVLGVVVHGRPEEEGGDQALGLFLNTIPVRVAMRGMSWEELVLAVYEAERSSHPYRRYPLAQLLRHHTGELFDWVFNYTQFTSPPDLDGVACSHVAELSCTNFAVATDVVRRDGMDTVVLTHDTRALIPRRAEALVQQYTAYLHAAAGDAMGPVRPNG